MNLRLRTYLSSVVLFVLVGWAVLYGVRNFEKIKALSYFPWTYLLLLYGLSLLNSILSGFLMKLAVRPFGVVLTPLEWLGIPASTGMGNYLVPFGGSIGLKSAYLKWRHGLHFGYFGSVVGATYLLSSIINGGLGLLCIWILDQWHELYSGPVALFFLLVLLAAGCGIALQPLIPSWEHPLLRWVNDALVGWQKIQRDRTLVLALPLLIVTVSFISGLSLYIAFRGLSADVKFLEALLIGITAEFAFLINITPGGLGVREAIIVFSAHGLGISADQSLLSAIVSRVITVLVTFTWGPLFGLLLWRQEVLD